MTATARPAPLEGPSDFSLVLGGPLYQLLRRGYLSGDVLELVRRRLLVSIAITWLPLLVLSVWEGRAWGGAVRMPFLLDLEVNARFLVALPLLIVAELVVHQRMRPVLGQFLERGLIPDRERPRFEAAVASAVRLRNSVAAEVVLILLVYGVGVLLLWRSYIALDVTSWYGEGAGGRLQPSAAGWWLGCMSLPLIQFLLVRWYFRLFIWARLLWKISRLELSLIPTHPDRAGGLSFLGNVSFAFAPVLAAQGVLLAGMIGNRIFFMGARLPDFRVDLASLVLVLVFMVLGPLLVFAPTLARVKRVGQREYGMLAQRYVREFDQKWLRGGAPADEPLVGSGDVQSLADLANSFEVVKGMRLVPFSIQTVVQLGVFTLAPVLPLVLTMISLDELVQRLMKVVF
jgi:hypothetical protein